MKLLATFICILSLCVGVYFVASLLFDDENIQEKPVANIVTFNDLPESEKANYIAKDDLNEYGSYITPISYQQNFEVKDEPISGNEYELIAQIKELRVKNRLLFEDNIDLVGKNWDMIIKLRDQKNIIEDEKKILKSKNLEVMNDIEKQHYQNINDLTKKMNEIQKDSLESSKIYEHKIVELENKIDEYQKKLEQKDINFNQSIAEATKEQRISNSSLNEKNRYLTEEVKSIKAKMTKSIQDIQQDLDKKNSQIDNLKQQIVTKDSHINELLTKHTKELMDSRSKNDELIKKFQQENKIQRDDLSKELSIKNSEILKLNGEILKIKLQHQEEIEKSKNANKNQLELAKQANIELTKQKDMEIQDLRKAIEQKDIELTNIKSVTKDLDLKLKNSQNMLSLAQDYKNEESLIKSNFKILNDKITKLEIQKSDILKELEFSQNTLKQEQNNAINLENSLKIEIEKLQEKLKNANQNINFKEKFENLTKEQEIKESELNSQITKLKNDILQLKQNSFSKDEFNELKSITNQREIKLQNQIVQLEAEIQRLNKIDTTALSEKIKEQKSSYENKIMTLENTINSLKNEKQISKIGENSKQKVEKLEQENKNLKLQIADLQNKKIENDSLKTIEELKEKISILISKEEILKVENEKIKDDFKTELLKKQKEIIALKEQNESDKLSKGNDETKILKEKFKVAMNSKKELENENEELKIKLKDLETPRDIKTISPTKPKFVAQIECDDIKTGQNNITKSCQTKVSQFLQKYNANYTFEVIPIVDGGGFKYLALAKDIIPKEEVERITNLANFGLGKDRANSAGKLIIDEFGDFAKISYANEISIKPNKRGFIIKVFQ